MGAQGVSVQADVTLDIDISSISPGTAARAEFEASFAADMAALLGVQRSRIQIIGITGGSAVVQFSVLPSTEGVSLPTNTLIDAFNEDPVELAGASAGALSGTTTARYVCTQQCDRGFHDADCNSSTACSACMAGEYSSGGVSPAGLCIACAPGFTDHDLDGRTACTFCLAGRFSDFGA
jgi:hypothetical protein